MAYILTNDQVREAIYVDPDFNPATLTRYASCATSFLLQKTGYDFTIDDPVEPLAIECAMMYVRQLHFQGEGYRKDHDYTLGIVSLLEDLKDIARGKNVTV
jgi:hypothetical protein